MKLIALTTKDRTSIILSTLVIWSFIEVQNHSSQATISQMAIAQQMESRWRKTRIGWVDTAHWNRPVPAEFERRIELVHPFIASSIILLTSLGLLFWSTEEKQWAEVFSPNEQHNQLPHS